MTENFERTFTWIAATIIGIALCAGLTMPITIAATAQSTDLVHIGPEKKLIEWGWDEPNPAYMRANARRMAWDSY